MLRKGKVKYYVIGENDIFRLHDMLREKKIEHEIQIVHPLLLKLLSPYYTFIVKMNGRILKGKAILKVTFKK